MYLPVQKGAHSVLHVNPKSLSGIVKAFSELRVTIDRGHPYLDSCSKSSGLHTLFRSSTTRIKRLHEVRKSCFSLINRACSAGEHDGGIRDADKAENQLQISRCDIVAFQMRALRIHAAARQDDRRLLTRNQTLKVESDVLPSRTIWSTHAFRDAGMLKLYRSQAKSYRL